MTTILFKLLVRLMLILSTACILLMVVTLLIGELVKAEIYSSVLKDPNTYANIGFLLVDLERGLYLELPMPISDVDEVPYSWQGNGKNVLLFSQEFIGAEDHRQLYYFNLATQRLQLLLEETRTRNFGDTIPISNIFDYVADWSQDRQMFAYISPDQSVLRIFNTETFNIYEIPITAPVPRSFLQWSLDNQQIAMVANNQIVVVNADGTNLRQFDPPQILNEEDYYLNWFNDSRRLFFIQYFVEGGYPLTILDTTNGEFHANALDIFVERAVQVEWCGEERISYYSPSSDDSFEDLHMFDLETSETLNLNEFFKLPNEDIYYFSATVNGCKWIVIWVWGSGNVSDPFSLYLFHIPTQELRLLAEMGGVLKYSENGFYYRSMDANGTSIHQVYLNDDFSSRQIGHINHSVYWLLWGDDLSYGYGLTQDTGAQQLIKYFPATGEIDYLLPTDLYYTDQFGLWR